MKLFLICYYRINNTQVPVNGRFKKIADHLYGFSIDQAIPTGAVLLIDPIPTRRWGTYYGGAGFETIYNFSCVTDNTGNVFICGETNSPANIATAGAFQTVLIGLSDAFLVKFSTTGQRLWGTYYGGDGFTNGYSCTVDPEGNIFLVGRTASTTNIATAGAFQTNIHGWEDGFLVKFNTSGSRLWGTYYGGTEQTLGQDDHFMACSTDTSGNVYCAGWTTAPDFIATPGAVQTTLGGAIDATLIKFTGDGQRVWGTYYGGTSYEGNPGITVSKNGFVYLSGTTISSNNIATPGSFMPVYNGNMKAFLACFNLDGTRLWGTYFGGEAGDEGYGCIADTGSNVYLYGYTSSTTNIATAGVFQLNIDGTNDGYVEKFSSTGERLWGTYYGQASVFGAAVDDSGFVFITGGAGIQSPLIYSPSAYQTISRSIYDAYLAKLTGNGQRVWGTYYGGTGTDAGMACAVDHNDNIYLYGSTASDNNTDNNISHCTRDPLANFIVSPGSHQPEIGGEFNDAFLIKFADCWSPDTALHIYGPDLICQNTTGIVFSIDPIPSAADYHWCVIGDLTITSGQNTTSITVDVGSAIGIDTISVYGINSCDTGFPKVITRRVYKKPVPIITGTDTTCTGFGTLFTTEGGKSNYQWTVSPGGTIVTGGTATDSACTIIWSISGAQWIRVSYTDTTGCSSLTPTQFNVWVIAGSPVSVSISASLNPVCESTSVIYTAIAINGGSAPSYQWKVNGINQGTNNSVLTYTPVNGDVITCVLTSSETCTLGNPATSNQVLMVINTNLAVSVTIGASPNPVCAGSPVTFTATPVNGGNSPTYQWKVNGINVGTNSPFYTYIPLDGDVVSSVLSSSETCITNNPASSNQVTIVTIPHLVVGVSITASANPVCSGIPVTFTATPVNGGNSPVYQWKVNGTNVGTNSPTYTYIPLNGDLIVCILNSSETCTANNPATSNQVIMVINTNSVAGVSISASVNPFCPGNSVTFTAATINGGPTPFYQWKVNGANTGSNSSAYTYNPASGDVVSCVLTSNLNCVSGNPATSNTIIMSGTLAPIVTFTRCFDSITTTNAKPFKLKGGIPLGGTYSGPGVNSITGIFNPALAGAGAHPITYTYTNAALCSAHAIVTIVTIVPIVTICGQILTDIRDGKTYLTIQIGSQCWLAEDLNYGVEIPANVVQRDNCIAEKYHNPVSSIQHPVSVYQWDELVQYDETISNQGLCPPGWHVPSEADWNILFSNYINNGFAASPLKYSGFSGFNALLSGVFHLNSQWNYHGFATFFWSSTAHGTDKVMAHGMNDVDPSVSAYPAFRTNAFSVRCIKDN